MKFSEMEWADQDGDRIRFSWDDSAQVGSELTRGCIQIFDSEDDRENAIYVDKDDARRIIVWLTERLRDA